MFDNTATFYQRRLTHFSNNRKKKKKFYNFILIDIESVRIFVRKTYANRTNRIEYKFSFFFLYYLFDLIDILANNENYLISLSSRRSSLKFQTYRPIASSSNNSWHYSCELSLLFEYNRTRTERSRTREHCRVVR